MEAEARVCADQYDPLWERMQVDRAEVFDGSRPRLHYLARLVQHQGPVLNVGIGGGFVERELLRRGTAVYAVDPSQRSVERLRSQLCLSAEQARVGRVEQLPFPDDFFGAVVISEVMEHLADGPLAAAVTEMHRVLRPGGILVGTVPARERLVDNSHVCPSCQHEFHTWGHYQSFDCRRMNDLLATRFRVERVFERPFVCWGGLNWKGRIAAALKLALYRLGIHGGHENIVFQVRKPSASEQPQLSSDSLLCYRTAAG